MAFWAMRWRRGLFCMYLYVYPCCALEMDGDAPGQLENVPRKKTRVGVKIEITSDGKIDKLQASESNYPVQSEVMEAYAVVRRELASESHQRVPLVLSDKKSSQPFQSSLAAETALRHDDSKKSKSSSREQECVLVGMIFTLAVVFVAVAFCLMSSGASLPASPSLRPTTMNRAAEVIKDDISTAAHDLTVAAEVIETAVIDGAHSLMDGAHEFMARATSSHEFMARATSSAYDYYSSESDEDWNNQEELSIQLEIALFIPRVNNLKTFHEARSFIREKGGALVLRRELESLGFLETHGEQLSTNEEHFNAFARLAAGKMVQPGMAQEQAALGKFRDKFLICRNREEDDQNCDSNDIELLKRASMSRRHRILTTKDLHWQWCNPLVFGMVGRSLGGAGIEDALEEVAAMKAAALEYCKNIGGWSDNVKLFFTCYGHCNVNSLFVHILDMDVIGEAFRVQKRKTCPFEVVSQVLEEEAARIAGTHETAMKVKKTRLVYEELSVKAEIATKLPRINDVATFQAAREILQEAGGPARLRHELLDEGFIDDDSAEDVLSTGTSPFNFFARLGAGLEKQESMVDQQAKLGKYQAKFIVCQNRPEADKNWNSSDSRLIARASMSRRHVFLTKKADQGAESYHWQWFNPLVYGLVNESEGGVSKEAVLAELEELKAAAMLYVENSEEWSANIGLFLNCYPHSSIHAMLLHVVDMSELGPAFKLQGYKNLPLGVVMEVLDTEGF